MLRLTAMVLGVAALGIGLAATALADDLKSKKDAEFVKEAASGGMLEVKLGKLATERGMLTEVREFGERMVKDHTKLNLELAAVAEKNGIVIPKELNQKDQATYDKLKDLKGAEFDLAYIKRMVKEHEQDVADFTKFTKDSQDDRVKTFATQALPVIKGHLKLAREISEKLERQ